MTCSKILSAHQTSFIYIFIYNIKYVQENQTRLRDEFLSKLYPHDDISVRHGINF